MCNLALDKRVEAGKKLPPEIMEITIRLEPEWIESALDFNQFTFDEIKLNLPARFSESKEILTRSSTRPKLGRTVKRHKLPEPETTSSARWK